MYICLILGIFIRIFPSLNCIVHVNVKSTGYKLSPALEKYALRKTYGRENELQRLERLENLAFGAVQSGNPVIRFKNVENAILSRPQYNTKQSLLNNVANYFAGQTTGFTPSITSYPNYTNLGGFSSNPYMFTPKYSNSNYEQYSNGIFGGGWGMRGSDFGTGSSIRILD